MLARDEWKLSKYANGGAMLFNLRDDPQEQHNLARTAQDADTFHQLDAELTSVIMDSVDWGHADKRVYTHTLSGSTTFGRPGWPRTYPMDIRKLER
jgi:arylsulfatase A-like enzyme